MDFTAASDGAVKSEMCGSLYNSKDVGAGMEVAV